MTTEKTLIKLEEKLSKANEKIYLLTGKPNERITSVIESIREVIQDNEIGSMA